MLKKIPAVCIMGILLVFSVEATMVSFMVIETGVQEERRNQSSDHWENGLLDVFFDAGYIVSNFPMMRFDIATPEYIQMMITDDIEDAKDGGSEYFIMVQLDYSSGEKTPGEISLILYRINPYNKMYERQIPGKTYRTDRDEINDVRNIVTGLVSQLRIGR